METNNTINPYNFGPVPIPLKGTNLTAPEIFTVEGLSRRIGINHGWLAAHPRTTRQIHCALFPQYEMAGMTRSEVFEQLNAALWEEGFRTDEIEENASWSLPNEDTIPLDGLGNLWAGNALNEFRA